MTKHFELPDEKARTLLKVLYQNVQADNVSDSFYWDDGDIDTIEGVYEALRTQYNDEADA